MEYGMDDEIEKINSFSRDGSGLRDFLKEMGPGQLDHSIRQVVQIAWFLLPAEKRNIETLKDILETRVGKIIAEFTNDIELFQFDGE